MSQTNSPRLTTRRSSSYLRPTLNTRRSLASIHSQPSSTRRGSLAPITPPHSPTHSDTEMEMEDDIDMADSIVVGSEPRYSGPETQLTQNSPLPPALRQSVDRGVQVDNQFLQQQLEKPQADPPLRSLHDEAVHLHRLRLTDFEVRGTLGTGTFGKVLLVRHRERTLPQQFFAMKVLRKTEIMRLRQVEHVNAERYILSRVQHPFVVDLFATFRDSLNVYMLMSYVPGGELFTVLRRAGRFTADVTRFYLATIILALKYLHSFNIIYRDLKPENLLLDERGYLRLTDFGFSKIVDDRTWTLCGTPEYLAPEIIRNEGHGKAADWWACGVLAYEMMVGHPPFFDETPYGIYEKIVRGEMYWPRHIDPLSKQLIKGFLDPDRSLRLGNIQGGPDHILEHPWFRGVDWGALERREIQAPIVPQMSSGDDTRHFIRLPLPPNIHHDMPGLFGEDSMGMPMSFDLTAGPFIEF